MSDVAGVALLGMYFNSHTHSHFAPFIVTILTTQAHNDNHRKVAQYCGYADNLDGNFGHGTAVASIIAGNRQDAGGWADGVAPDAKLVMFDISIDADPAEARCCKVPPQFSFFLNKAMAAGARIHNVSWGTSHPRYIVYDQMFDAFLYQNSNAVVVISAGNKLGFSNPKIGSPALAKNGITGKCVHFHFLALSYLLDARWIDLAWPRGVGNSLCWRCSFGAVRASRSFGAACALLVRRLLFVGAVY
jgi:hypothetical protein